MRKVVKRSGNRGFSLVEVLIVIVILAIVVVTLITVFIYGFNLVARIKQTTLATQVAQFEAERYRNMAFGDIAPQPATTSTFVDLYGLEAQSPYKFLFRSNGDAYLKNGRETITIEDGPAIHMTEGIKKLTVTIEWDYRSRTIAGGNPMRKDVVTYLSSDGVNRR
jgi:prepilin-type N-terminal cleavage/methylation domain-containing protein